MALAASAVAAVAMAHNGATGVVLERMNGMTAMRDTVAELAPMMQGAVPYDAFIVSEGAAVAETPFTVKAGERVNVSVILQAGVLAVTAPGASEIGIFKAKADLAGNRTQMSFNYADTVTIALPEGDYVIEAVRDGVKAEATAKVTKGERTETTVP